MDIKDFKNKLDNREFWGVNSEEAFKAANEWADEINETSINECEWSWDCGLKLDYDGDIIKISSRFYPPHKSSAEYGKYHGDVTVYFGEEEVNRKTIEAKTLDELREAAEKYVFEIENKLKNSIKRLFE